MKRILLSLTLLVASLTIAQNAFVATASEGMSISDMALNVKLGTKIDEDGYFPVEFTYTVENDGTALMPYGMVYYTVYNEDGEEVIQDISSFDVDHTSRTLYVQNLSNDNRYTIVLDKVEICDLDMETFQEVVLYSVEPGIKLEFSVPTPGAVISDMALNVKLGTKIDEDGYFPVEFTYTVENDGTALMPYGMVYYTVYNEDGEEVIQDISSFDVDHTSRTLYVQNLSNDNRYTIVLDKVEICDLDMETFQEVVLYSVEPGIKLEFSVPTPLAVISDMALRVEDGATIDPEDGTFPMEFTYKVVADNTFGELNAVAYYTIYAFNSQGVEPIYYSDFSFDVCQTSCAFNIPNLKEGGTYICMVDHIEIFSYTAGISLLDTLTQVSVQFTIAPAGVGEISTDSKAAGDGKFIENGNIIIVKNGVKYNAQGIVLANSVY